MKSFRSFVWQGACLLCALLLAGCSKEANAFLDSSLNKSLPIGTTVGEETTLSTTDDQTATVIITERQNQTGSYDKSLSSTVASSAPSSASQRISFTVGAAVRIYNPTTMNGFSGRVIHNREALEELSLDDSCPLSIYTEAYFDNKALLVLYVPLESGSIQLQIDELVLQNSDLTVQYTTIRPNPSTADMAYWQVLVEVSADEINNVHTVTGERRRVTLSSTQ